MVISFKISTYKMEEFLVITKTNSLGEDQRTQCLPPSYGAGTCYQSDTKSRHGFTMPQGRPVKKTWGPKVQLGVQDKLRKGR